LADTAPAISPATATPAVAGNAAPAAAPPATPAPAATDTSTVKPAQTPRAAPRRIDGVLKKSFGVRPAQHEPPPKDAPPAATTEGATVPQADAGTNDHTPAATASTQESTTAATDPGAAKLTDAEESRRMARINRAEAKLQADRRAFADERAKHAGALSKVQLIEQARELANKDPLRFMAEAFGVAPKAILDSIIAEGAKPEATKLEEKSGREAAELRAKIAELEKSVQTAAEAQKAEAARRDVAAYKSSAIVPVLADATKYELTRRALGDKAADEVFDLQQKRFLITQDEVRAGRRQQPEVLSPAQAADLIEQHLRSQRDLLTGASVAPAKLTQPTARKEPPPVSPSGSQTQNPAGTGGKFRVAPKPYNVKSVR
jgi:hypothetical protein